MYFNFKSRIFINKLFVFFPLFLCMNVRLKLYFLTFLFALLHECAHFCSALILGEKTSSIFINPYGFELKTYPVKPQNEIKIIAAGPFFSFALWLLFLIMKLTLFSKINFIILAVNLLPALPLDGGRILKIILRKKFGYIKSALILRKTGRAAALILMLISFFYFNVWLLCVSLVILLRNR